MPRTNVVTEALIITMGAALIALSAQIAIPLPFTPVPVTLQPLAVLLVGASMGSWRGAASAVLYIAVGMLGLPVYAEGHQGLQYVVGATGGFLIAFPIAAAVTGWLSERWHWDRGIVKAAGAMLVGSAVIYVIGLTWLSGNLGTGFEKTLELGFFPFVLGDICKVIIAALALPGAWKIVQKLKAQD
jgi:biotin transport system substrate-specific component